MYICNFCGYYSEEIEDFEMDEQHHKGFWCPYCDGFTYFEQENQRHNFVLILENPTNNSKKSKFVGPILAYCNSNHLVNFVEPYASGASVGLSLLLAGKSKCCCSKWHYNYFS